MLGWHQPSGNTVKIAEAESEFPAIHNTHVYSPESMGWAFRICSDPLGSTRSWDRRIVPRDPRRDVPCISSLWGSTVRRSIATEFLSHRKFSPCSTCSWLVPHGSTVAPPVFIVVFWGSVVISGCTSGELKNVACLIQLLVNYPVLIVHGVSAQGIYVYGIYVYGIYILGIYILGIYILGIWIHGIYIQWYYTQWEEVVILSSLGGILGMKSTDYKQNGVINYLKTLCSNWSRLFYRLNRGQVHYYYIVPL